MQCSENQAAPQPVSFEIDDVKNANAADINPPIKQRLEQKAQETLQSKENLTHQMIDEKLERAGERKAQVILSQISQSQEENDKVLITQERRASVERAQGERTIKVIDKKLEQAQSNRTLQLTRIVDRARRANDRVLMIRERKSSLEKAQEEKIHEVLTQKQAAEVRASEKLSQIQEKAKMHNERAQLKVQARKDEERKDRDDLVNQIENKKTRQSQLKEAALEKAKSYNQRVQERLENYHKGKNENAETLMFKIEEKLQNANSRRENRIEQVKNIAAQSATQKSPQKTQ